MAVVVRLTIRPTDPEGIASVDVTYTIEDATVETKWGRVEESLMDDMWVASTEAIAKGVK